MKSVLRKLKIFYKRGGGLLKMLNTQMIEESMELLTRSNTCSTYKNGS